MASSSNSSIIHFPRLPSVSPSWDPSRDHHTPAQPLLPRAGRTLKQSRSTESLTQRKDRVDFLRKREWTRRVAASADQPTLPTRRARTYSWEDIIAAADAAANSYDYDSSPLSAARPDTIHELDEDDEPYVIYTASPRPSLQSANSFPPPTYNYTPNTHAGSVIYSTSSPSPSPSPSPTLSPLPSHTPVRDLPSLGLGGPYHARRLSWRGPHSRHSSLSSISEEDEGLARF